MKFISRHTDYAMRALAYMAKRYNQGKDDLVTVEDIVKGLGLPEKFTRRILQKLAQAKILNSYKGKQGGFSFKVSPSNISLVDVLTAFQGGLDLTHCFLQAKICPNMKKCFLRKRLKEAEARLKQELDRITVASLL